MIHTIKQLNLYKLTIVIIYLPLPLFTITAIHFPWGSSKSPAPGPAGASELPPDASQLRRHPGGSARAAGAMPRGWGDRGDFPRENHGKFPAISKC